jgi:dipeptide/tripeptide permease
MVIPAAGRVGRASATLVWVAIALVLADVIAYRAILGAQGGPPPDSAAVVPFVGGYMLLMAALLGLSLLGNAQVAMLRPAMLAAAAAGLLLLGFFALFSIGLPLSIAGILSAIAAIRSLSGRNGRSAVLSEVAGAVIALMVLLGGFEVTQSIIVCPPTGTMGGGSSGFLTGPYHYRCDNGTLTWFAGDCSGVTGGVDSSGNPISTNGC